MVKASRVFSQEQAKLINLKPINTVGLEKDKALAFSGLPHGTRRVSSSEKVNDD